jgi:hypothetical protein
MSIATLERFEAIANTPSLDLTQLRDLTYEDVTPRVMDNVVDAALVTDPNKVKMVFKQAPNAGAEAHRIWDKGMKGWGDIDLSADWQPEGLSRDRIATVDEARRNSFFFIEVWGRKAQSEDDESPNPLASVSHYQPGLGMTDLENLAKFKSAITTGFLAGLEETDYLELNLGPRKKLLLIETDLSAEEMHQRLLDVPDDPYKEFFPHLADAQQVIQGRRKNSKSIFADVFNSKTGGLHRAFQEVDPEEGEKHEWGWQEEDDGEFYGINLDYGKQSLKSLADGASLKETAMMLNVINKFMKGKRGRNRFIVQIDDGEDAVCCNDAFNAAVEVTDTVNYHKTPSFNGQSMIIQRFTNHILPDLVIGEKDAQRCGECGKFTNKEYNMCQCENGENKDKKKSN